MKKIKAIGYILLIAIVVILSLTIYTNASKDLEKNQKEKTFAEIKLIEGKIANLLNTMNNIEVRNYKVVTSELSNATTQKSSSDNSSSKSGSSNGGSSEGGSQGASGEQSSSDSSAQSTTSQEGETQDKKKFELKSNGVLTNTQDINWESIKSEVEGVYTSLPTITMDLYQSNVNQEDVLAFNAQFDKLTSVVKDEKKEETLTELTKVYEYLPKFLRGTSQEELYTTLVETKYHIFNGYAKLDGQNWQEISNDIKSAVDNYSKLLTNTNIDTRKQYNISKGYIMLNELQNAVSLQDTTVFLIKYKNLLEEFNNI